MSEGAIEPTRVYQPGEPIRTGRQRIYDTYNTRDVPIGGDPAVTNPPPPSGAGGGGGTRTQRIYVRFSGLPGGGGRVATPQGVPKFLGNRSVILLSWVAAMFMVSFDEWHTYHILPRPARLWFTSLTYILLALASTVDDLVPLTTALAIGFTIAVAYNYYQNTGQFGQVTGTGQAPGTTTAGGRGGASGPGGVPTTNTGANPGTPPSRVLQ